MKRRLKSIGHYETEAWNIIHKAESMEHTRVRAPGGLGKRIEYNIDLAKVIADALRKKDEQSMEAAHD